ncbi:MAG: hypothetical protein M3151_04535 [Actinomycetota bacterium]|nr:hypothetical protein [Actinomycetota bacterium]
MSNRVEPDGFKVVAVTLFGKIEVARYPTLEQAEWRVRELSEEAERSPRGYVQYLVSPVRRPPGRR